jgi:endonuclease/exonuclease/phosphatase family metal-dependent hydrolase
VLPHVGPEFSFEGFEVMGSSNKRRIDYIFVNDKVDVLKHAIISDFRDGRYPSDHLPVIAEIRLE